jgi:hypothetical protein
MNGLSHGRPRDDDLLSLPFSSPPEHDPIFPAPRLPAADGIRASATDRVPGGATSEATT